MKIYKRNDPSALMANPTGKLRGPGGRRLCRWCGTETKPPRRCWCSQECIHKYSIRANAGYARGAVALRDDGVCGLCGLNCSKLRGRLRKMSRACRWAYHAILGLPKHHTHTLWEVDHILPVVEGGGSCGLENLRTLCIWCHRKETKKLAARRARKRRTRPTNSVGGKIKSRARGL